MTAPRILIGVVAAASLALVAAGIVFATTGADAGHSEVTIGIRFSRFDLSAVTVRAGEPVTFRLENRDPIEHEWLVGDEAFHARHRTGTEAFHDSVADEVTIPAFAVRTTTVTFDQPGDYEFICHLPGHEQYGMKGIVHVVE